MAERLEPQPWMADSAVGAVFAALEAVGGEGCARFVGGCVRDALLARPIGDIDIATPLTPPEVVAALEAAGLRAVPTGIDHGTVTAVAHRRPFEITTLRRDVSTDGRRAVVAFTADWGEDARRRDFRLNALYLDRRGGLYDPVGGGVDDARAGRIVFVGDPAMRIREDWLRVLRFFRFQAWYGRGQADPAALAACAALKAGVATLSGERLAKELLKLLAAPDPRAAVTLMAQAGVLAVALPQAERLDRFQAMVELSPDPELRLAALLPDDPAAVAAAARRLKLSNMLRDRLAAASVRDEMVRLDLAEVQARRALYRLGPAAFRDRVLKLEAETPAAAASARRLVDLADGWSRPSLPVGGAEVMASGVHGPEVGRRLAALEQWWMDQDFTPDRDALLLRLAEMGR